MSDFLELPEWAADRIYVDTDLHFGWLDRLRILWFGRCELKARTTVEHAPGRCETVSRVIVPVPRWPWRKRMQLGVAEAPQ